MVCWLLDIKGVKIPTLVATDYICNTTWKDVIVRIDDKKEITTLSSSAEIFFTDEEKSCLYRIHLDLYYLHYILT